MAARWCAAAPIAASLARVCVLCALLCSSSAWAAQIDIIGPGGSVAFGATVKALPNGNIVVVDPNGPVSNVGAVYLYSPTGTLINSFTGSTIDDQVGSGGVFVVGDSNFVVLSPRWNNDAKAATLAGAATWVNGNTGLSGVVSDKNSLVGTTTNDSVGYNVTVVGDGNYLVGSPLWNGLAGALTWASGATGLSGEVSASNSLVGAAANDNVGGYSTATLSSGNYVARTPNWNGVRGAVTWGNAATGVTGLVSADNSLVGAAPDDAVGVFGIAILTNGNYVVSSAYGSLGAATWLDGSGASTTGTVSADNSLVGTAENDLIGYNVVPLSNGNYVVGSPQWGGFRGAATWADGAVGLSGIVSASNSLVGAAPNDRVGIHVVALSNGNYIVAAPNWNGGRGAVTWGDGATGLIDTVSVTNSLFGTTATDSVGYDVTALSNGNYVVASPNWNGGRGAATWASGTASLSGVVSAGNSLVGSTPNDLVAVGVTALSNGNYVVRSSVWNNAQGAATWGDGATGTKGTVSASNSLVGTNDGDPVGLGGLVTALSNGNYVVASPSWDGGRGATTWASGITGVAGFISSSNSLVGTAAGDQVGSDGVFAQIDGAYVVASSFWNGMAGADTLASGSFRLSGTIQAWNSVQGTGYSSFDYDATHHQLVVGRPGDNIVSLFTIEQIFASSFE